MSRLFVIVIFLWSGAQLIYALDYKEELDLYRNIRCVTCPNQSISESNSPIAQSIKTLVKEQLNYGKTRTEIEQFLVKSYGADILYTPPLNASTSLLWFGPFLVVILGGYLIIKTSNKSKF